jgi:hypothetical protein
MGFVDIVCGSCSNRLDIKAPRLGRIVLLDGQQPQVSVAFRRGANSHRDSKPMMTPRPMTAEEVEREVGHRPPADTLIVRGAGGAITQEVPNGLMATMVLTPVLVPGERAGLVSSQSVLNDGGEARDVSGPHKFTCRVCKATYQRRHGKLVAAAREQQALGSATLSLYPS